MRNALFFIACMMLLTGCEDGNFFPVRTEISQFELVRAIALDRSARPDYIRVTVISKQEGQEGGKEDSGQQGKPEKKSQNARILSAEAESVNSAIRKFQQYSGKQLFLGHSIFCLIGEKAARENIAKYLDYVSRDQETRPNKQVYIVEGDAGSIFEINAESPYFFSDRLKNIAESVELVSVSKKMKFYELINEMDKNESFASAVPAIRIIDRRDEKGGFQKDFEVDGYGIIKNFKLIGFIHNAEARAYNFITDQVKTGSIDVTDTYGNLVSMEILGSSTRIIPAFEGEKLSGISIKTKFETNINEMHGREDIFSEEAIHFLEKQQEKKIKSDMEACIKYAKKNKADFLDIGSRIKMRHPIIFEEMQSQWSEIFSGIPITIDVSSKINRSYDIVLPSGYKKEGEK